MAYGRIGREPMSGIAIYMEGGGNTAATRSALRLGMDAFLSELKDSARSLSWHWKLVCCGGRDEAFKAFKNARNSGDDQITLLLVDAEESVNGGSCQHLTTRDNWDLAGVPDEEVHLMIQTMESWIVADKDTLKSYYGQYFAVNSLPNARNLETVAKTDVANALDRATRLAMPKGIYRKIRHASDLLKLIDPQLVRQRCPGCERLFATLGTMIN